MIKIPHVRLVALAVSLVLGFAVLVPLAYGDNATATPALVQSVHNSSASTATFVSPVTAGNTVIVGVTAWQTTLPANDISDSKGNIYTRIAETINPTTGDHAALFYAKNVIGGSSFMVTAAAGDTIAIHEYSGLSTSSPLDKTASAVGFSNAPASANVTAAGANELYFGLSWSGGNGDKWTAGPGYALRQTETNNNTLERLATEDKVLAAASSTNASFITGTNSDWIAIVATFKPQVLTSGGTGTTTPPAKPVVTSFTATPSSITSGQSSNLSWATTGATLVTIDNGVGTVTGTSKSVSPTATTTYTLSAGNSAGTTTATVTVSVVPAVTPPTKPVINSFTASPSSITTGQTSNLSWATTGATLVTIDNGVGTVTGTSKSVSPTATTTYTLSAGNSAGTTTATVTVTVAPVVVTPPAAPTCSISANPTSVVAGNSSTLTFSATNASSSSINNGVGAVPNSGTKVVTPTATTTYTDTVINPSATGTCSATVTVTAAPPPAKPVVTSFTATPSSITSGQSSNLSWATTGATLVTIDNGVGTVTGTSKSVSPTATTTYTLSAGNSAGTTTATVTVNVAPVVVTPPSNLIPNGNFEAGTANAPTGWNADFWGSLTAKFTYPVIGNGGGKAAQVQITKYSSGDAKWDFDHVNVSSHTIYNYSEDYESNVATSITIEYTLTDGTFDYEWVKDVATSTSWSTVNVPIFVPSNATSFTVLHTLTGVGTLTVDNAVLVAQSANAFPSGMVTFSFDDGLLSQFQNAVPMLNTAGMKSTFYIISNEPSSGDSGYMTWAQVKSLNTQGFDIAGHTRTHPYLTTLTPSQLTNEVTGSYTDLIAQGITPKTFAYPFGDVNAAVEAAVKAAGYQAARGSYYGENSTTADHYDLYDIRLDTTSTLATVEAQISQAVADKRWIVFEIHDVLASGGDVYTITPAFLQSVINFTKQSGAQVVTAQQGMQSLSN